MNTVFNTS